MSTQPDTKGEALIWASKYGSNKKIISLVEKGVDINYKDSIHGETALMMVACRGEIKICRFLIENGININAQNENGTTALGYAVSSYYRVHIVRLLIEKGANINIKNKWGVDVASDARNKKRWHIIEILNSLKGPLSLQHIVLNLIEKEGISHGGLPEALFRR